jgi:cytochrome c-type biogenesis protein CcmF
VFVGTLYPLALEAVTGEKISVGAPFFNLTFAPLFIPLLFAMPFGPMLAWKRGDVLGVAQRLMAAFGVGIVAIAVAFAVAGASSVLAPFGIGLAFYVVAGAVTDLVERTGLFRMPLATARMRAAGLPRSTWGTAVAHSGIAMTLLGVVCQTWATERIIALKPNQTVALSGYDLSFDGLVQHSGPNFRRPNSPCAAAATWSA